MLADAVGPSTALLSNINGGDNALAGNTSGGANIGTGFQALYSNMSGNSNVAVGFRALRNATGSNNLGLGSQGGNAITSGSNNVDIANAGVAGDSGKIRIGTDANQNATYIAGIWQRAVTGPTKAVVVNKNGRLGTAPAPAAPLTSQARTVNHLRAQVRQQGAEIARLRELVSRRTG